MKTVYEYGSPASSSVLIQMVDDHDLDLIDNEVSLLQSLSGKDFHLLAVFDAQKYLSYHQPPKIKRCKNVAIDR